MLPCLDPLLSHIFLNEDRPVSISFFAILIDDWVCWIFGIDGGVACH